MLIEFGKVLDVSDGKAKVKMQRNAACGDCGACHVSKSQMEMTLNVDNNINAQIDDEVELNIENVDFLSAVLIMYGIPLLALVLGIFAGYYGLMALGYKIDTSQAVSAVLGLGLMSLSFMYIKSKEKVIKNLKKYKPVMVRIISKKENN